MSRLVGDHPNSSQIVQLISSLRPEDVWRIIFPTLALDVEGNPLLISDIRKPKSFYTKLQVR